MSRIKDKAQVWWTSRGSPVRSALRAEGMVTGPEAEALFRYAGAVNRGTCIVEVGSFRGRSTIALGLGSLAGATVPVYAVDPHEQFLGVLGGQFGWRDRKAFMRNVSQSPVAEVVRLINLSSKDIAPLWHLPVGLLFLDGDHTYEGVRSDYEAWMPHLSSSPVLALDDSTNPELGPSQLIAGLLLASGWVHEARVGKITFLKKHLA
jgi:hypothetical protein